MKQTKQMFTSEQFVATEWDSAADKAKFANHFVKFVESDFAESKFPKWFYTRLSMTFGFIAHYNQQGFFSEYFRGTADKIRFLRVIAGETGLYADLGNGLGLCGDPAFTYRDVENELRRWVKERDFLTSYRELYAKEVEVFERSQYERLKAKYA